jgi:hypothetical protein
MPTPHVDAGMTECAMPSRQSTSSHHYFMAPGEAVELRGWCSNSLAADSAPGAALNGALDACAGVCCHVERTAAATCVGRLEARGMEDAASSSIGKSSRIKSRCSTIWTMVSSKKIGENLMPSPYLAR